MLFSTKSANSNCAHALQATTGGWHAHHMQRKSQTMSGCIRAVYECPVNLQRGAAVTAVPHLTWTQAPENPSARQAGAARPQGHVEAPEAC